MQNRENAAIRKRITAFGFPSHTRTFDSLSYFFITASTSSAVPVKPSAAGALSTAAVCFLFRKLIVESPSYSYSGASWIRKRLIILILDQSHLALHEMRQPDDTFPLLPIWSEQSGLFLRSILQRQRDTELRLQMLQSQGPAHSSCRVQVCRCCRRYLLLRCRYRSHLHRPAR